MNFAQYGTFKETFLFVLFCFHIGGNLRLQQVVLQWVVAFKLHKALALFFSVWIKNSICVTDPVANDHICHARNWANTCRKWLCILSSHRSRGDRSKRQRWRCGFRAEKESWTSTCYWVRCDVRSSEHDNILNSSVVPRCLDCFGPYGNVSNFVS